MGMPAAIIGSSLIGAIGSSDASGQAQQGNQGAINAQQGMFNTVQSSVNPYVQAGSNALSSLGDFMGTSGNVSAPGYGKGKQTFTNADLMSNLAPNYNWQLQQGLNATNNLANSSGGKFSGNTMVANDTYAQGLAGNAYQQAFNNFNTSQGNIYNRLAGIANIGTQANQTLAGAASGAANGIAQGAIGAGNAAAAGTMGVANSLSGGLQTYGGMNYLNNLNAVQKPSTSDYYSNSSSIPINFSSASSPGIDFSQVQSPGINLFQ